MSINSHTKILCRASASFLRIYPLANSKQHSLCSPVHHAILYLFSSVVAVSYAAALPQPAGLSEKYSNSANTTLASGLEARSYQPVLNSYKESATLMSLKRRDDSGSGSSLPSDTTPNETDDPSFIDRFTDTMKSSF
ncbi:hypothetical protein BASA62_007621 [Batrachochytrium salamandrivorans]|nr:hypothetical protein BASA62_007621 [Batrachochytrium salamandrivorans]